VGQKEGHRKRMYAALAGWSHEVFSTNLGVTGECYSDRRRKRAKVLAHKLLRQFQKRQDRKVQEEYE
jgi:hypothetical protein